ncbi:MULTISPECIES: ornithine--oxo-acid transaminase [Kocuria]|jgi:ornithine--oxo-acid transaminase|uniref:ornithine--oxo-acid transaminase n=1 Tax=Kocuria TaxID=57493 RepID=UPI000DFB4CBE|nr:MULTISPECIES: ornithine--oxo-acid transaminase [Kocuria]WIG17123.1 ornithine--oxo-acid transaminase [Kocuria rosea]STX04141.1 Ornithine aminotransferase [Kocuria rosea]STX07540.1 Ornithine aminotransferase [Kocuria rosea]VEH41704.1 Ornithine aminotransferase [Kocuria rosea]
MNHAPTQFVDPAAGTAHGTSTRELVETAERYTARTYSPLDVVAARAQGTTVTDVEGREYLDFLAGYSALNFGHGHPAVLEAARTQLERVTLTSRAVHNDQLGPFARELCELLGQDMMLPMNTGAEAVESAIKVARKWGYERKGVAPGRAQIVVAAGNFHGRTTTVISFSDDDEAHRNYGPYTPGFVTVPFGDLAALEAAVTEDTVAVLLEPIQGEAGVIVPPPGYLQGVRRCTAERGVLLVADEIQSGLGRTGRTLACEHEDVEADLYLLGKALGGGVLPVSAVVGRADVLSVLRPGQHGSTFGGNPLAGAVGRAVVALLATGEPQERARVMGEKLHAGLAELAPLGLTEVRGRGLWAGIDIDPRLGTGRECCERLVAHGILAKDTHGSTIRLSPPLVITDRELERGLTALADVLREMAGR